MSLNDTVRAMLITDVRIKEVLRDASGDLAAYEQLLEQKSIGRRGLHSADLSQKLILVRSLRSMESKIGARYTYDGTTDSCYLRIQRAKTATGDD